VKVQENTFETRVRTRLAELQPKRNLAWLAGQLGTCEETMRNWFKAPGKLKAYQRVALMHVLDMSEAELFEDVAEVASE